MANTAVERLIHGYLDHLVVERGMSTHTVASYRRDLFRYADFLTERGIGDPGQVTAADITAHAAELSTGAPDRAALAPASVARAVVAIRSLHRFAAEEGITADNPAAQVQPPRAGARLPKALSLGQVEALLAAPDTETPTGLRDRALLELLYGTGARISEVVGLDVDDVSRLLGPDADEDLGLRLIGKGNKERIVPLGGYARQALDAWLVRGRPEFARRGKGSGPALLLNARGNRLSRQSAWAVLQAAAAAAKLEVEVSPHTLRHSYATHLLDGGADVRVVQELLGHASVTTTQIYTLVTVDHLRETYLTAHPRAY
ncbi:site-specific tyrosine recombinase XerD [Enemella evansiae]|uniref:Tyrosine recombinase XerD n=1 Tax=Enemella evansiae TaxID=2016499 RepID=A0A255G9Q6_9ACTN|nr:site-specific tyrosine recombinase XerD [Enemella evansiae]OYO09594.1 site-specific tyrosine recombinase XerD [Enemella evansiae]